MANKMRQTSDCLATEMTENSKAFSLSQLLRVEKNRDDVLIQTTSQNTRMPTRHHLTMKHTTNKTKVDQVEFLSSYSSILPPHYLHRLLTSSDISTSLWHDFFILLQSKQKDKLNALMRQQHITIDREHAQTENKQDHLQQILHAINGQQNTDLKYCHYFQYARRTLEDLSQLLEDHLNKKVDIKPLQGKWVAIDSSQTTRLFESKNQLGKSIHLGRNAWHGQQGIKIMIGPLRYSDYNQLLPHKKRFKDLCLLTRSYLPITTDFLMQFSVLRDSIPSYQLHHKKRRALGQQTILPGHLTEIININVSLDNKLN